MIYRKLILAVAILLAAITPLWAIPDVPTLTVDTLTNLGKFVQGEACGAFFLPDGNIIAVKGDTPYIIDSKSGAILRTLDKSPIETVLNPELSKDGTKLLATVMGPKLAVWDIPSGKVTFPLEKEINYFCLSPGGTKLYVTLPKQDNNPGIIVVYDVNTFQEIERLSYSGLTKAYHIDITPDGQTLAVVVNKSIDSQTSYIQIILINLNDKKNYSLIESYNDGAISLQFSPDGKRIASLYDDGNHIYIYIYDLETKAKKYIRSEELSNIFDMEIFSLGRPLFIDANTLMYEVSDLSDTHHYHITWNINETLIKNYININYNQSIDFNNNSILICNYYGIIGFLDKNIISVNDKIFPNENSLIYRNYQLEFYSNKSFIAQSMVYDTTGKMIENLGSQSFAIGRNIIRFNQPLPIGVYLITMKNGTNQFSYKFIVE